MTCALGMLIATDENTAASVHCKGAGDATISTIDWPCEACQVCQVCQVCQACQACQECQACQASQEKHHTNENKKENERKEVDEEKKGRKLCIDITQTGH